MCYTLADLKENIGSGYYLLMNDIDASKEDIAYDTLNDAACGSLLKGGVINGNSHTIYNLKGTLIERNLGTIKNLKQRWTRGYKRYKETSGLIEWKECQIFHSIFT